MGSKSGYRFSRTADAQTSGVRRIKCLHESANVVSKNEGCPSCPGETTDSLSARQSDNKALDGFLQFLRGAERDLLAGLDLDRLAGRRVTAHARGALAHLQDTEAADADAVALLEVLDDEVDHVVEDQLSGLLGELMLFGKVRRDVLQGEGRGRCFRCHGSRSPCSTEVVTEST